MPGNTTGMNLQAFMRRVASQIQVAGNLATRGLLMITTLITAYSLLIFVQETSPTLGISMLPIGEEPTTQPVLVHSRSALDTIMPAGVLFIARFPLFNGNMLAHAWGKTISIIRMQDDSVHAEVVENRFFGKGTVKVAYWDGKVTETDGAKLEMKPRSEARGIPCAGTLSMKNGKLTLRTMDAPFSWGEGWVELFPARQGKERVDATGKYIKNRSNPDGKYQVFTYQRESLAHDSTNKTITFKDGKWTLSQSGGLQPKVMWQGDLVHTTTDGLNDVWQMAFPKGAFRGSKIPTVTVADSLFGEIWELKCSTSSALAMILGQPVTDGKVPFVLLERTENALPGDRLGHSDPVKLESP